MVAAAMDGHLDQVDYKLHPVFKLAMPVSCPGVPEAILNPQATWPDAAAYQIAAKKLAAMFHANFAKFTGIPPEVVQSGPQLG